MPVFHLRYRSNGFPSSQYYINRIFRRVPYTQLVHGNERRTYRISQVWFMDAPHSITCPIESRSHMLRRDHCHRSATAAAVVYRYILTLSLSPQTIVQPPRPNECTAQRAKRSLFQFNSNHWHLFGFEFCSEQCTSLIIISKKKSCISITQRQAMKIMKRSFHQIAMCAQNAEDSSGASFYSIKNGSFLFYTVARWMYRFPYFYCSLLLGWIVSRCAIEFTTVAYDFYRIENKKWQQRSSNDLCLLWHRFESELWIKIERQIEFNQGSLSIRNCANTKATTPPFASFQLNCRRRCWAAAEVILYWPSV